MVYKISPTSKLQIEYRKAILVIRRSFWSIGSLTVGILITIVFSYFFFRDKEILEGPWYIHLFSFIIIAFTFVQCFFMIGSAEHVEIDLSGRMVTRWRKVFGINYKTFTVHWPKGSVFKYEIDYDSYKNIDAIWLVAYSQETNESQKLFRFFDKKTFLCFQKIFNENFPDYKILEWHD